MRISTGIVAVSLLALVSAAPQSSHAQGVPVSSKSQLQQHILKLQKMIDDFGQQEALLSERKSLAQIETDQLALLEQVTKATSSGQLDLTNLEGNDETGAEQVYPTVTSTAVDNRLFGDTRQSLEMMIAQVSGEFAPVAAQVGLTPTQFRCLFQALIKQESRFNVTISSPVGAYGLTQLMPGTASDLGVDRYDPMDNLRGGADYITKQLVRFGNIPHALAAYNAGPGRVIQYGGVPPFKETQGYVRNITKFYNEYLTTVGGVDALGTLSVSDWALAEYSNTSDALMYFGASSHASIEQVSARLQAIITQIDKTENLADAVELNTYARAEIGRIMNMRIRLLAGKQKNLSHHGMQQMADRLRDRKSVV